MATRFKLPRDRVTINEETLRDGEQTAGVTFLLEDKVAIACVLAETLPGCIINAGYPPISPAEQAAVQAVARQTTGAQIECAGRATPEDFQLCYEAVKDAERPRVAFWFPVSRLMLETRLGRSQTQMLDEAVSLAHFARDTVGDTVGIDVALADASRAEVDYVIEACDRLTEAGADMLVLCDTIGLMLPHEVHDLVNRVTDAVPEAGICFHGHHDLGNGTANSIVALRAGAQAVATAVHGLGERAGMPPTEEVVTNLLLRADAIGRPLHADSAKLLPLSKLVANRSGIQPQTNKPVVGEAVLRRETGSQVDWMQRDPQTFQLITPAFLGKDDIEIVIGKMSSHGSIKAALSKMGIQLGREELHHVFLRVKDLTGRQRQISEQDIRRIIEQVRQKASALQE